MNRVPYSVQSIFFLVAFRHFAGCILSPWLHLLVFRRGVPYVSCCHLRRFFLHFLEDQYGYLTDPCFLMYIASLYSCYNEIVNKVRTHVLHLNLHLTSRSFHKPWIMFIHKRSRMEVILYLHFQSVRDIFIIGMNSSWFQRRTTRLFIFKMFFYYHRLTRLGASTRGPPRSKHDLKGNATTRGRNLFCDATALYVKLIKLQISTLLLLK